MSTLYYRGYSLAEILIVVAILGLTAVVVIPVFHSNDENRLDIAADALVQAARFARSEAMRTGQPTGFHLQTDVQRLRLFTLDTTTNPWTPLYKVRHPISKKTYDIRLSELPAAALEQLTVNADYPGSCNTPQLLYFDRHGTPYCSDPNLLLLTTFSATLAFKSFSRIITVHGMSGRVTLE